MSKNNQIAVWVIIILIVIGLGWWMFSSQNGILGFHNQAQNATSSDEDYLDSPTATTISSTSSSNADLNSDFNKVDAQMNGLDQDTTNTQ